jgi:SAM-dependent methyltransferase/acyl carrier protein
MLESLGTLYVNGVNPDWKAFDRKRSRKKVALPTYPWKRKQYWAQAAKTRQRRANKPQALQWQSVITAARDQSRQVPVDLNLSTYPDKWKLLDQIATAYMARTLFELGAFRTHNESHSPDSLVREFHILPAYRPAVSHWLKKLAAEGVLHYADGVYTSHGPVGDQSLEGVLNRAASELADIPFILDYMNRCGQMAPAILQAKASPLETLFPKGSLALAEQIYQHWAHSRYFSGVAKSACEALARTLPRGGRLRIAEIGAGTGGTTAAVLPVLPPDHTVYYFTDASQFFFDHARDKFKDYAFLRFAVLDIEKNPSEQGFREHGFDVLLASNVLHATRNLDETIENVLRLLSPGGLLILCEVTNAPSWIEFSYGLIENWHQFTDGMRQDSPLISAQGWRELLRSHGFEEVGLFPEAGSPVEILGEHCIIARAPAGASAAAGAGADDLYVQALPATASGRGAELPETASESFLKTLRQSPESEQRELLVELVRRCTMAVLRRDRSDPIGIRHRLMDLGIDSLMAVELRNRLSTELGLTRPLPATLIFDYPNVEAIAGYLFDLLGLGRATSEDTPLKGPQDSARNSDLANQGSGIQDLSDEEVEKLLLNKLQAM